MQRIGSEVPKTCEKMENVDHMWSPQIRKCGIVGTGATKCCHICSCCLALQMLHQYAPKKTSEASRARHGRHATPALSVLRSN
jgi:hypothetical protein